jgi:hypothetical protein
MNVPRMTSAKPGLEKKADSTYAKSANVSHLKVFAIRRYEPQI